jgi:hypothetical protein
MKSIISILLLANVIICSAQPDMCNSVSFAAVHSATSTINFQNALKEKLNFLKYAGFSFKDFKPLEGAINPVDFYEVGFNADHQIKQIVHDERDQSIEYQRKFIVTDFDNFRILCLQDKQSSEVGYRFTPIIFIMIKGAEKDVISNYAVNVISQFGNIDHNFTPELRYSSFPEWSLGSISAVMALDENFYPLRLVKLYNEYVVFASEIYYNQNRSVNYESAVVYLDRKPRLKMDGNSCLDQAMFVDVIPDMTFVLHPDLGNNTRPLWIYGGAHEYGNCVNQYDMIKK